MQTGNRWGGKANPRDLTKTRQQELLRQKAAREAAASVDIAEVQRRAREAGFSDGMTCGFSEGWNALGNLLIESGAITEERLLEVVNAPGEPGNDDDGTGDDR